MKKALIIGGAGFVGKYLTEYLLTEMKWQVFVTKLSHEVSNLEIPKENIYDLDILDLEETKKVLQEIQPDYIFHLAAQSSVALSWKNPDLTLDVNIKGGVHILEAARTLDYKPSILMIGSGEEYGYILPEEIPLKEDVLPRPGNIYAATKVCQNMISSIYAKAYQLDVKMVRAFNHIGPGQADMFVVANFCKQVAEIEAGKKEPILHVGNLEAKRDFTDVRDVVRAYALLVQHGESGETYNIGSGKAISIQELLERILALSTVKIEVQQVPERMRPSDIPIIEANIDKIKEATNWKPVISLETTLIDTLDYWRGKV